MLKRIFLAPPLAFARVGGSATPCDAFMWSDSDLSPKGTGQTTLVPTLTFTIGADGALSAHLPDEILFRDEQGIRPVAPFFELHGLWTDVAGRPQTGPVTLTLLQTWGGSLAAINWSVHLANLKAYHYTRERGDRIDAVSSLRGDQHERADLLGVSPPDAEAPLIQAQRPMPMGALQAPRPNLEHPEIRLRFYPPKGKIYGPVDANARLDSLNYDFVLGMNRKPNMEWRNFRVDADCLIANPDAHWPRYVGDVSTLGPFAGRDPRNTPGGLLAAPWSKIPWIEDAPTLQRSLGLLDDVSDGIVSCRVRFGAVDLTATARIVVAPPDFAPANRPPVSLADNLTDREARDSVRSQAWSDDELAAAVLDILERAHETSDLMHRDYQNARSRRTNTNAFAQQGARIGVDEEDLDALLWPAPDRVGAIEQTSDGVPLNRAGSRQHRRHSALEFLADRLRENPALIDQWIRRPRDPKTLFDKRMPALMRGSDGGPMHLTRRQWEILTLWAERLRADTIAAGAPPPSGAG